MNEMRAAGDGQRHPARFREGLLERAGGRLMPMDAKRHWTLPWLAATVCAVGIGVGATRTARAYDEPLRSIAAVLSLDVAELRRYRPVVVRGTLTFQRSASGVIQDGDDAIFIAASRHGMPGADHKPIDWPMIPLGSLVEITGIVTPGGYAPTIVASSIRVIEPGTLPPGMPADLGRLFTGADDNRRLKIRGVVQGAAPIAQASSWSLILESGSRRILIELAKEIFPTEPPDLVDAEVGVTGVAAAFRNTRGEFIGPRIAVARPEDLVVITPSGGPAFESPKVPLGEIARYRLKPLGGHRLRTEGVVSFATPGAVYLQEGSGGVRVDFAAGPREPQAFQPGDRVEVAGFLDMSRQIGGIVGAVGRRIAQASPPQPLDVQPAEIAAENREASQRGAIAESGGYDGCLIRCRATVEAVNVMPDGLTILLSDGETQLAAELPRDTATQAAVTRIKPGSEVEVTGIVQLGITARTVGGLTVSHPALERLTLLVRSAADIAVVRSPPWWTPQRLAVAAGLLAAVALGAIGWGSMLRREVKRQTERAVSEATTRREAAIEYEAALRERGRIAADLHDTLLQTLTGIGYKLQICRANLGESDPKAITQVESAERLVEHAGRQLRGTVWSLRAMPDVRRPLPVALGELLHVISTEHATPIRLHADGVQAPIDDTAGRELLLVVQEAVLNALHHGRPGSVDVTLAATPAGVTLKVDDNGTGFDVGRQPGMESGHFGMQGMRERVERLGGTCEVASTRGAGTTVTVRVPQSRRDGRREAEPRQTTHAATGSDVHDMVEEPA